MSINFYCDYGCYIQLLDGYSTIKEKQYNCSICGRTLTYEEKFCFKDGGVSIESIKEKHEVIDSWRKILYMFSDDCVKYKMKYYFKTIESYDNILLPETDNGRDYIDDENVVEITPEYINLRVEKFKTEHRLALEFLDMIGVGYDIKFGLIGKYS